MLTKQLTKQQRTWLDVELKHPLLQKKQASAGYSVQIVVLLHSIVTWLKTQQSHSFKIYFINRASLPKTYIKKKLYKYCSIKSAKYYIKVSCHYNMIIYTELFFHAKFVYNEQTNWLNWLESITKLYFWALPRKIVRLPKHENVEISHTCANVRLNKP